MANDIQYIFLSFYFSLLWVFIYTAVASLRGGFSYYGAQDLGTWASAVVSMQA